MPDPHPSPPAPFTQWSVSTHGAIAEARALLAESAGRGAPALVDLGYGQPWLGYHPFVGEFAVSARAEGAPESLPRFVALVEAARHVHAGGDSPEGAATALVDLVAATARRLATAEADERDPLAGVDPSLFSS